MSGCSPYAAAGDPAYEEKAIRDRLSIDGDGTLRSPSCEGRVIHVARPDGQAAVMRLAKAGIVRWTWCAEMPGVMLVRRGDGRLQGPGPKPGAGQGPRLA